MVVDGNGQGLLCLLLTDDILVQNAINFLGNRQMFLPGVTVGLLDFFTNDIVAKVNTLITDENFEKS